MIAAEFEQRAIRILYPATYHLAGSYAVREDYEQEKGVKPGKSWGILKVLLAAKTSSSLKDAMAENLEEA